MWFETFFIKRFFYTLKDLGLERILLRLNYEIVHFIDKNLPLKITWLFIRKEKNVPQFVEKKFLKNNLEIRKKKLLTKNDLNIEFIFLNKKIKLKDLIIWDNKNWNRLLLFNIHYFDWSRSWLDEAIDNQRWPDNSRTLPFLIDSWIHSNTPKNGDGWHSYTTSLRLRNWIWLFLFNPDLLNSRRISSIWHQVCWLRARLENHHSGNHLLENLISLCFGGIVFNSNFSENIYYFAINNLEKELRIQILDDGGHEERSSSYHIILLDRLTELGCLLKIYEKKVPDWLYKKISQMMNWLDKVRLINNNFPIFNDCSKNSCGNLHDVYLFAKGFLTENVPELKGLRGELLKVISRESQIKKLNTITKKDFGITDLKETGWTFLRFGSGWELVFKCGVPCPKHLGAHVHSDQLSFDLFNNGKPIIIETGTSSYDKDFFRKFERSSRAHNTLQLGIKKNYKNYWVEPVDVWDVFKAGKKSMPLEKKFGIFKEWLWVEGSHNGFNKLDSSHVRRILVKNRADSSPILIIIDNINTEKDNILLKSWLHFHNNFFKKQNSSNYLEYKIWESPGFLKTKRNILDSYFAIDFNLRKKRKVFELSGKLKKGKHTLITIVSRDVSKNKCNFIDSNKGLIRTEDNDIISWDHQSKNYKIKT